MRSITLFIPGLFGSDTLINQDDFPSFLSLESILSKSKIRKKQSIFSVSYSICDLFGLDMKGNRDQPIAGISRLIDADEFPKGIWMRADPIHLMANYSGLILADQYSLNLTNRDTLVLAADIKQVLEPYGLFLEVPSTYRWYVKVSKQQTISTTPLDFVIGKNIFPFTPKTIDSINWLKLFNEIQMTLHMSDINRIREQENKLPINSIWFWGCGTLPETIERCWSFVVSNEILSKGLSIISTTPFMQLPASFDSLKKTEENFKALIVIDDFQAFIYNFQPDKWLNLLFYYEKKWFAPILSALKTNELDELRIETIDHSFIFHKMARFKLWKKNKKLPSIIESLG